MSPTQLGPWSSASYAQGGMYQGEIVSINDPLRRNRVQVRIWGYQGDKATIPNDKLEWVNVLMLDSQLSGATSTHSYFPGSKVVLGQLGTELIVTGSLPGFDSDTRNTTSAGVGISKAPDTPMAVQGQEKTQGKAGDGRGRDIVQLSRDPKVDKPLSKPEEKKAYDYAKTNAPYEKGDTSKFPDLKSLGIDKLTNGSDVIGLIKSLDGNASGAIKAALDVLSNLRNNGFGISKEVIGVGPLQEAAKQFQQAFGSAPSNALVDAVNALASTSPHVQQMSPSSAPTLINDGSLQSAITALSHAALGVNSEVITSVRSALASLQVNTTPGQIALMKDNFSTGVQQAVSTALEKFNSMAVTAGGGQGFAQMMGDTQNLKMAASSMMSLASSVGIPAQVIQNAASGAFGAALNGNISSLTGSIGKDAIAALCAALNMFKGNSVALNEILSGKMDPSSLLKIPLKYAKKAANDPAKKFAS